MKWLIYTRGIIHPHRLYMAILSFQKFYPSHNLVFSIHNEKLWWGWDQSEINAIGQKLIKRVSNPKSRDKYFNLRKKQIDQAIKAAEKIRHTNLKKLSNQEIINLYQWLYKEIEPAHGYLTIEIDAIDVIFENFLKSRLASTSDSESRRAKIDLDKYQKLSQPLVNSYITEEELYLKKYGPAKTLQKFWWTSLGWECLKPRTLKYYQKTRTKHPQNNFTAIKKLRSKETKEVKYWLDVMDKFVLAHDWRKEMQVRTMYSLYLLMKETAQRLKLNKDDLEWLIYPEIYNLLNNKKLNQVEINRRKKHLFISSNLHIYSGATAFKKHKAWLGKAQPKVEEFKGTPATPGLVTGKVKVCTGGEDARKRIKKGDILVCGMTLPDYLPAMKKAKAIITDEGGITCHAAIVSRELETPCIVGTKIATQVLKDGDRVEVDANKGIVKLL